MRSVNQESHEIRDDSYLHFYTILYPSSPQTLFIYWYKTTEEHLQIFQDCRLILEKMREFSICTTYTGDIFCIKNERLFLEQLMLLGITFGESCSFTLINGIQKEVFTGKTDKMGLFNDAFDICFEQYPICQSFSSFDPHLSITVLDKQHSLILDVKKDSFADKHLLMLDFFGHSLVTTFLPLQTILYSVFDSSIDNPTLNRWFCTLIQKKEYHTAVQILQHLQQYNNLHPIFENRSYDNQPSSDLRSESGFSHTSSITSKPKEWIRTFCELYLEESNQDILLSEVYQDFLVASQWLEITPLSMASFVKSVRALNRFTFKRRSKGMTILGCRSLVSLQTIFQTQVKQGLLPQRNLLHYLSPKEIHTIIQDSQEYIEVVDRPFVREACILLHTLSVPFDAIMLHQFCSIPSLVTQLPYFKEYIDGLLSQPYTLSLFSDLEHFRNLSEQYTYYFPFNQSYLRDNAFTLDSSHEDISLMDRDTI